VARSLLDFSLEAKIRDLRGSARVTSSCSCVTSSSPLFLFATFFSLLVKPGGGGGEGRASVVGGGLNVSNIEPKLTILFWISITSDAFGVGSKRERNLIIERLNSGEEIEGMEDV
jgi:hypothetical protein